MCDAILLFHNKYERKKNLLKIKYSTQILEEQHYLQYYFDIILNYAKLCIRILKYFRYFFNYIDT